MAIIALRGWYIDKYEPIQELKKRPYDIRLSKNSLLKSGLRADFLEESSEIEQTEWFNRYLWGELVEFYIEGSGGYAISNIDLSSHEIYFHKHDVMAHLDPKILLCRQDEYPEASVALQEHLEQFVSEFNRRSRIPLTLEISKRPSEGATRLSPHQMRQIRKSLLFVADTTPLAVTPGDDPQLLPSPNVCIELGYALQSKRVEQIVLAKMERSDLSGQFPFDLPTYQQLEFRDANGLGHVLPHLMESMLQRFNLVF
ncbi:MAG: hypothetical protein J7641_09395 [Cyanobacteria bacterium SID2]|nr:hypothetical protein [Cyanobacteria bacterium SID2]